MSETPPTQTSEPKMPPPAISKEPEFFRGSLNVKAAGLMDIELPSMRRVLVWFTKDPTLAMDLISLISSAPGQPNFEELWKKSLSPTGDRLFPSLDKLLRPMEGDITVGVMIELDEKTLALKVVDAIKASPKAMRAAGIPGSSGVQVNPGTVLEAAEFIVTYVLPLVKLFLRRKSA